MSDFNARFPRHPERMRAVGALVAAHPELRPVFGDPMAAAEPAHGPAAEPGRGRAAGDAVEVADAARGVVEAVDRQATATQAAYDPVADLYACTFADVRVRRVEWRWLESKLPPGGEAAVLDVGCGCGGLLSAISSHIGRGVGLDVSQQMLAHARERNAGDPRVSFALGDAARAPYADGSFDVVVSFLSLHYLTWPSAIDEIMRVLTPGGRLLCVDMVASPVRRRELHRLVAGKTAVTVQHLLQPRYAAHLRALVRQPAWQAMERRYPLRPLAEYAELAAVLGARLEVLTVGAAAKVVAFEAVKRTVPASTVGDAPTSTDGDAPASTDGADGPVA